MTAISYPPEQLSEILAEVAAFLKTPSPALGSRDWLCSRDAGVRLYVRVGGRYLGAPGRRPVLTLATIELVPALQSRGLFGALLERLKALAESRGLGIFVESVMDPGFASFLLRRGFKVLPACEYDFYWLADSVQAESP